MAKLPDAYRADFEAKMASAGSQGERASIQADMQAKMSKVVAVTERLAVYSGKTGLDFTKSFVADAVGIAAGNGSNRYTNTTILPPNAQDKAKQKQELNKDVFAITESATSTKEGTEKFRELTSDKGKSNDDFKNDLANLVPEEAREGIMKMKEGEIQLVRARLRQIETARQVSEMMGGVMKPFVEAERDAKRAAQEHVNTLRQTGAALRALAVEFSTLGIAMASSSQNSNLRGETKIFSARSEYAKGATGEQTGAAIEAQIEYVQTVSSARQTQRTDSAKAIQDSLNKGTTSKEGQEVSVSDKDKETNAKIKAAMQKVDVSQGTPEEVIKNILANVKPEEQDAAKARLESDASLPALLTKIQANTQQTYKEAAEMKAQQTEANKLLAIQKQDDKKFGGIENFLDRGKRREDTKEFDKGLRMTGSSNAERRGEGAMRVILQAQKDLGGSLTTEKAGPLKDMAIAGRAKQIERTADQRIKAIQNNKSMSPEQKKNLISAYQESKGRSKEIAKEQVERSAKLEQAPLDAVKGLKAIEDLLNRTLKVELTNPEAQDAAGEKATKDAKVKDDESKEVARKEKIKQEAASKAGTMGQNILEDKDFAKAAVGKDTAGRNALLEQKFNEEAGQTNQAMAQKIQIAEAEAAAQPENKSKQEKVKNLKEQDAQNREQQPKVLEKIKEGMDEYDPKKVIAKDEANKGMESAIKNNTASVFAHAVAVTGLATAVAAAVIAFASSSAGGAISSVAGSVMDMLPGGGGGKGGGKGGGGKGLPPKVPKPTGTPPKPKLGKGKFGMILAGVALVTTAASVASAAPSTDTKAAKEAPSDDSQSPAAPGNGASGSPGIFSSGMSTQDKAVQTLGTGLDAGALVSGVAQFGKTAAAVGKFAKTLPLLSAVVGAYDVAQVLSDEDFMSGDSNRSLNSQSMNEATDNAMGSKNSSTMDQIGQLMSWKNILTVPKGFYDSGQNVKESEASTKKNEEQMKLIMESKKFGKDAGGENDRTPEGVAAKKQYAQDNKQKIAQAGLVADEKGNLVDALVFKRRNATKAELEAKEKERIEAEKAKEEEKKKLQNDFSATVGGSAGRPEQTTDQARQEFLSKNEQKIKDANLVSREGKLVEASPEAIKASLKEKEKAASEKEIETASAKNQAGYVSGMREKYGFTEEKAGEMYGRQQKLDRSNLEGQMKRKEEGGNWKERAIKQNEDRVSADQKVKNLQKAGFGEEGATDEQKKELAEAKKKQSYINRGGQLDAEGNMPGQAAKPGAKGPDGKPIEDKKPTTIAEYISQNTQALIALTQVLKGEGDGTNSGVGVSVGSSAEQAERAQLGKELVVDGSTSSTTGVGSGKVISAEEAEAAQKQISAEDAEATKKQELQSKNRAAFAITNPGEDYVVPPEEQDTRPLNDVGGLMSDAERAKAFVNAQRQGLYSDNSQKPAQTNPGETLISNADPAQAFVNKKMAAQQISDNPTQALTAEFRLLEIATKALTAELKGQNNPSPDGVSVTPKNPSTNAGEGGKDGGLATSLLDLEKQIKALSDALSKAEKAGGKLEIILSGGNKGNQTINVNDDDIPKIIKKLESRLDSLENPNEGLTTG